MGAFCCGAEVIPFLLIRSLLYSQRLEFLKITDFEVAFAEV